LLLPDNWDYERLGGQRRAFANCNSIMAGGNTIFAKHAHSGIRNLTNRYNDLFYLNLLRYLVSQSWNIRTPFLITAGIVFSSGMGQGVFCGERKTSKKFLKLQTGEVSLRK